MKALQIHAGATALKHLRERGLQPADVRIIPGGGRRPEGADPERARPFHLRRLAERQRAQRAPAGRVDRRLAHGHRLPGRPGGAAGADGRGLHPPGLRARARQAADAAPCEPGLRRQAAGALRRPRGRGAGPPALPPACLHQPRPPCAAAPGAAAHAAGLHGCVPDQHRQPQGHGRLAGARGLFRCARAAAAGAARLPHAAGAAGCDEPAAQHPGQLLDPVLAGCRARHSRCAARRLLGRRHHRLPPAPGLRLDARGPGAVPALPEDGDPGLAGQGAEAPPPRHRASGQGGAAVAAAGVDRHAAECQAARPQRLQGLRRRPGRPRGRLEPRAARKPAPGGRIRARSSARASPSRRCRWPETTIRGSDKRTRTGKASWL